MIKKIIFHAFLIFTFQFLNASAFAETETPIGKWLTIDDEIKQPRSIVEIQEAQHGLQGKITKIYFRHGEKETDICGKCSDSAHKDQPILGMTILWNMQKQPNGIWSGGQILDPHNGKIYRCQLKLSADGQHLDVHGYIGIPILGRSQTWIRVSS